MYTLYYSPGSASFAVHWMLIELRVPFEAKRIDFKKREQKSPEYLRLNPIGQVPTLIVDGQPCTQSAALLMLLAERHPEAGLAPDLSSARRPQYLELMVYLANASLPAFRAWFYPEDFGVEERFDDVREDARARIEAAFDWVDSRLSDGREFLLGSDFSAPDILATMLARWSRNMPKPAASWPRLNDYLVRMRRREALREVHRREELTDWIEQAAVL